MGCRRENGRHVRVRVEISGHGMLIIGLGMNKFADDICFGESDYTSRVANGRVAKRPTTTAQLGLVPLGIVSGASLEKRICLLFRHLVKQSILGPVLPIR